MQTLIPAHSISLGVHHRDGQTLSAYVVAVARCGAELEKVLADAAVQWRRHRSPWLLEAPADDQELPTPCRSRPGESVA